MVGRKQELADLRNYYESGKAEFVALYGRRRVGKTYLINEFFESRFAFYITGVIDGDKSEQIAAFTKGLRNIGYTGRVPGRWMDAFFLLEDILQKNMHADERCVIFIDELPCFDTPKAGFVKALGHFWNSWAQHHKNILLIVCGSATSWMIKNIIDNHGGLHDRITHEMHLHPFNLSETEQMLQSRQVHWDRLSIMQMYMVLGGIPYYLELIKPTDSVASAIDRLFFGRDASMANEYDRLFKSLFKDPTPYMEIIRALALNRQGISREEILKRTSMTDNGHFSEYLTNLVKCDFIRYYFVKNAKIKKNDGLYQLTDMFVIFYNTFLTRPIAEDHFWSTHINTPRVNNWCGLSFERVCMLHIPQIKRALGIDRIGVEYYTWRSKRSPEGAQIDLLLERADRIINLCEMKYSTGEVVIDKDEDLKLRNRQSVFVAETATRYAVVPVLVSTYGMKTYIYSGGICQQVVMDDLFNDVKQN